MLWNDLLLASAAGLLGAPHCIGMCGGTVSAIALQAAPRRAVSAGPGNASNADEMAGDKAGGAEHGGMATADAASNVNREAVATSGQSYAAGAGTANKQSAALDRRKGRLLSSEEPVQEEEVMAIRASGPSPFLAVMLYNFGRVTTYTFTGLFMGAVGSFLNGAGKLAGMQGAAAIAGGLLIFLWLYRKYTLPMARLGPMRFARVQRAVQNLRASRQSGHLYAVGVLLGFLPCGLTYAMQMNAASGGNPWAGAALLAVFGLSTMPALLFVGLLAGQLSKSRRGQFRKAANGLTFVIALLAILRGMAANGWIPSVHPWLW